MPDNKLQKFIRFVKVDNSPDPNTGRPKRQVWGIVTAERPDKDNEVCDYAGSKPFYEAVIAEMSKATDGRNFFPLRAMHGLDAVGKCIGFDFRDADREIFMGFKVVDDGAWNKVEENVYTGFSQGGKIVGEMLPDPVFKGCMRYVADPSECSLVDNPCLADAHFAYVTKTGEVEMRKFSHTYVDPVLTPSEMRIAILEQEVKLLKAASTPAVEEELEKDVKTKRVAGEDLTSSAFAYVGDKDDPSTWKLPIKFSSDAKTKSHIRNALARFNQTQGIPAGEKDAVHARIVAAAKQHGIDVDAEKVKYNKILEVVQKYCRVKVNALRRANGDVGHTLDFLDSDLGKLRKGMYEVSGLAEVVNHITWLLYSVIAEQEWEDDVTSLLPAMLADHVNGLLDTLVEMVAEETEELRTDVAVRLE